MRTSLLLLVPCFLTLAACNAGVETSENGAPVTAGPPSLLDNCGGDYECDETYRTSEGTQTHRYKIRTKEILGGCSATLYDLRADGIATKPQKGHSRGPNVGTWTGDAGKFKITAEDTLHECTLRIPLPSGSAQCTGTPTDCSYGSPGSCARIHGCRMQTRVRYNGTYDNSCEGTADSCDTFSDAESCANQGCYWKP